MRISNDGQFFYESMNPAFERSLGISIDGEKAIHDCMSEEDAKSICASCDACLAERRPVRYQHRLTLDGRRREFDTTINPVRDSKSGNIVRLVGSHLAVEERAAVDAVGSMAKDGLQQNSTSGCLRFRKRCSNGLHPIYMIQLASI